MRRTNVVSAIFFVLLTAFAAVGQASYQNYSNARFAYFIEYPSSLMVAQDEAANADGRIFLGKNGNAKLTVWGQYNALGYTLRKALQSDIKERQGRVTYKALLKDGYVISGTRAKTIFYQKTIFSGRPGDSGATFATFLIEYDANERAKYDPVVARISKSFKFE